MKKLFIALCVISFALGAREIKVTTTEKLYRLLAAAPYSLVFFNNRSAASGQQILDTEIMLRSLRKSPLYEGSDIQIIGADVSRGNLAQAMKEYRITTVPTFITCIGRQLVGDQLQGFADRAPIMALIDKNIGKEMQTYMQQKAAQRKRDLEIARIDAYKRNYWLGSPYWDSYWYGGYYPYWYGPYFW